MPVSYPWYALVSGPQLEQGDILRDCLVPIVPRSIDPSEGGAEQLVRAVTVEQYDRVIVLTQSCDLEDENVPRVMLCPVHTLEDWVEAEAPKAGKGVAKSKKDELRKGQRPAYQLLNVCEIDGYEFPHLVVDFGDAFSIELAYAKELTGKQNRVRLLPPYREHLSQLFARFYMRVGLPVQVKAIP